MIPVFGEVFGEPIPAYFALLMVGYALAIFVAARWAQKLGLDREVIIDTGLLSLVVGVAGGRILHVLADGYFWDYVHLCTDPSQVVWRSVASQGECSALGGGWGADGLCRPLEGDCFAWAKFWNGGLAYYGGLLAVIPTSIWFLRREHFPVAKAADLAGVVAPLGIVFGRLGCFFGGCCFGVPTDHAFGVSFPAWSAASEEQFRHGLLASKSLPSLPVHPAQLYEAFGCAVIAAVMAFYVFPRRRFDGQVFLTFLASYSVLRFLIEYVRADDRGALLGLSTSQWIGLLILGAVAYAWQRFERVTPA